MIINTLRKFLRGGDTMIDGQDEASRFKQQSLKAIKRNRIFKKIIFYSMVTVAVALMIAVLISYTLV